MAASAVHPGDAMRKSVKKASPELGVEVRRPALGGVLAVIVISTKVWSRTSVLGLALKRKTYDLPPVKAPRSILNGKGICVAVSPAMKVFDLGVRALNGTSSPSGVNTSHRAVREVAARRLPWITSRSASLKRVTVLDM